MYNKISIKVSRLIYRNKTNFLKKLQIKKKKKSVKKFLSSQVKELNQTGLNSKFNINWPPVQFC